MDEKSTIDIKYPRIGFSIFFLAAIVSFFGCNTLYKYAEDHILYGIDNVFIVIAIKMGLFFTYLVPIAIGVILFKTKNSFLQIIGMLLAGLGCGIVFKIALYFTGAINPYQF